MYACSGVLAPGTVTSTHSPWRGDLLRVCFAFASAGGNPTAALSEAPPAPGGAGAPGAPGGASAARARAVTSSDDPIERSVVGFMGACYTRAEGTVHARY